ncbi:NYN domain-containing protein [Lyophyllum atratum]|nr:NYN domain-containing protein [Lyophyllum atratum]
MQKSESVAIFWDFENLPPGQNISGYELVENIRSLAQAYGPVILFKAYLEVSLLTSSNLRSELQASGISLTDCPHNGRKDVADKMLIADMVAFGIDHPTPATIILISGDRDYAYAVSILRLRRYRVVVACPSTAHNSLLSQASVHLDWNSQVLGESIPLEEHPAPKPQPPSTSRRRASSTASRAFTPSISKNNLNEDDDEDDFVYGPRYDTYPGAYTSSARVNGILDERASIRYASPNEPMSWRHASSKTPSKPYSPPASFRSAKSSPPTPPALERASSKATFITDGDTLFQSSSKPTLPKGFPFIDAEAPTAIDAEAPSASQPQHLSGTAPNELEAPSIMSYPLPVPTPISPPLPAPPAAAAPTPATAAPMPSPPPVIQKLPERTSFFGSALTPAPTSTLRPASPAPVAPTPPFQLSGTHTAPPAPGAAKAGVKATPPPKAKVATPPQNKPSTVAAHFRMLITILEARARSRGSREVSRSDLGTELAKHKGLYAQAHVPNFAAYIRLATQAGIVETGGYGAGEDQWIALCPEWSSSTTFPASN